MQATSLATVDTVASATAINSVNKDTHCRAEGRVKKISSTEGRTFDTRRCECTATARTCLRVRPKDSLTCEDSPSFRDYVFNDLRVPSTAPLLRQCRGKRLRRRSPRLMHISTNNTTLCDVSAKG